MDLGAPIGIIIALVAMVIGMILLGANVMTYLDLPSTMLVVVPTFAALFIGFPTSQMLSTVKHVPIILGLRKFDPIYYVNLMTELAEKARAQGLLVLESEADAIDDPFVKTAVLMVADATETEMIEDRLFGVLDSMTIRHSQAWAIYDRGAAFAPAFGMCATIVALVHMLLNLDLTDAGGADTLGISMSAALITTLYGSVLANVFFVPLGNKLRLRHQKEIDCKKIAIDGILAIQRGTNPRIVKEMLVERLDPKIAGAMMEN